MSWSNPSRHPKFLAIRDKYRKLKQPYKEEITKVSREKERIWIESVPGKIIQKIEGFQKVANGSFFSIWAICLLAALVLESSKLLWSLIVTWISLLTMNILLPHIKNHLRSLVFFKHQNSLDQLEMNAIEAKKKLNLVRKEYSQAWIQSSEEHVGIPPDWSNRRDQVLARDGYKCTKCGYPEGFKRKSRELHVHHIVHISDGGDNRMSNLITLCHICHRNVDKHHRVVRKMGKLSSKKHW